MILENFLYFILKELKFLNLKFEKFMFVVIGVNVGGKIMFLKLFLSVVFLSKYFIFMKINVYYFIIFYFKEIYVIINDL